jgi:copper chaperone
MCGCATRNSQATDAAGSGKVGGLAIRVEDMTCGHCAGRVKKAVEGAIPGTQVDSDLGAKLVFVRGTSDLTAVQAIISRAGYTPSEPA